MMTTSLGKNPTDPFARLSERIESGTVHVGVVALGYVGLPLLQTAWAAGLRVIGYDTDPKKIKALQNGQSYLSHIREADIAKMAKSDRFAVTSEVQQLSEPDVLLVCVPTPLNAQYEPDLSYIQITMTQLRQTLRPGQLIVLESTTYPGTTREVAGPSHLN